MGQNIIIRKAVESDSAFIIESNIAMAMETEEKALKRSEIEPGVRGLFNKPEYGFYMIAEAGGQMAGSLMITYEWSDWRNGVIWWIQSVYVVPEFRRKGIYRAMYAAIKTMAHSKPGVCGFRLYVEKENFNAKKTYTSLGMKETQYNIFEELTVTV